MGASQPLGMLGLISKRFLALTDPLAKSRKSDVLEFWRPAESIA